MKYDLTNNELKQTINYICMKNIENKIIVLPPGIPDCKGKKYFYKGRFIITSTKISNADFK